MNTSALIKVDNLRRGEDHGKPDSDSKHQPKFSYAYGTHVHGSKESRSTSRRLPDDEVDALQEIAAQLGKKDWNRSVNHCNAASWRTPNSVGAPYNNTVNCNCSYPDGVCHVVQIFFKAQDLDGTLPPAVVKLPYLKQMSISANNLSGRIDYLGNITTLQTLSIESNLFSGPIPPELGNLVDLETLSAFLSFLVFFHMTFV
ncbi:hypothetical protein F2P56_007104 [Juglans regia]|uniref:Uncharacterized protein n=1 Tax=Juglans regia TaxID=51240 RepID=A0A834D5M2_JUGRE|nr:hypothetical protein F2P56_007104 [Juglans regia]